MKFQQKFNEFANKHNKICTLIIALIIISVCVLFGFCELWFEDLLDITFDRAESLNQENLLTIGIVLAVLVPPLILAYNKFKRGGEERKAIIEEFLLLFAGLLLTAVIWGICYIRTYF